MNVFYLDKDPALAAQMLVDKHVTKMIVESVQLLSTLHRLMHDSQSVDMKYKDKKTKRIKWNHQLDGTNLQLLAGTHVNHPCLVWISHSKHNYFWLADHADAIAAEYTYRYGKIHKYKSNGLIDWLRTNAPHRHDKAGFDPPPLVLPKEYWGRQTHSEDDHVLLYRHSYANTKAHIHSWKKRNKPDWIEKLKDAEIPIRRQSKWQFSFA